MKRFLIISIILSICGLAAMAQDPVSSHQSTGRDRYEVFSNTRQPSVSYDAGSEKITVSNVSGQYHAVVTFISTQAVIIDTVIDGQDDEIDLTGQEDGKYMLALTGLNGVTYRWTIDRGGNNQAEPYWNNGSSSRLNGSIWHQLFEF